MPPSVRNAPATGVADASSFRSDRTLARGIRSAPGRGGGLPKWAQLCKPRLNSPRRGREPLPATLRFPSSHLQTVHFPSRYSRGGGNPSLTPTPPPANAFLTGTRCRARCKPCGRSTIPRRGAHNHRPPGPAARTAREWGAPGGPRHSGPGTPLEQPAAPRVQASRPPPHSVTLTRPPPQPTPPRAQPLPRAPLLSPGAGSSPASPSPEPPQLPAPLTAAQRPAAAAREGGRRPGARKRPDRGDPGRTPYLGGRRGGDRRSGSASERGGRR